MTDKSVEQQIAEGSPYRKAPLSHDHGIWKESAAFVLSIERNGIPLKDYLKLPPEIVKLYGEGKLYEAIDSPNSMLGVKFSKLASSESQR